MAVYKAVRKKKIDGVYHTIYEETTSDLVKHKDGTTAEQHFNAQFSSDNGAHGFRYNYETKKIELYNADTGKWDEILNNTLTAEDLGAIPVSRTVNGKSLAEDISLNAKDVGAISSDSVFLVETFTQSQYEALATKDGNTLYLIKE